MGESMDRTGDIGYCQGRSARNNVVAFLEAHRRSAPDRPALVWMDGPDIAAWLADPTSGPVHHQLTFSRLVELVESAAAGLARLGIEQGDRVLVFVPMSPQLYVAMFAAQRLGASAVFLDSWARRDQLGRCAAQVQPKAFIGPEAALRFAQESAELARVDVRVVVGSHQDCYSADLVELCSVAESSPLVPVEQEQTALITFTTGSSGEPKGANRTHRFLAAQHYALDRVLPYQLDDLDLSAFPVFAMNNLAGGLATIIPAVDLAAPRETDGRLLVAQLASLGATCCTVSPSLLRAISAAVSVAAANGRTPFRLRRVATGGAVISQGDVAGFQRAFPGAELHILYGSTEVEPIAHRVATRPQGVAMQGEGVCVGRVVAGLASRLIRICRDPIQPGPEGLTQWLAPPGQLGELIVSGEHVCHDYYHNPEAMARAKIQDSDGVLWHRTGDVCRFDESGQLWMLGRVHNVICRGCGADGQILFPVGPENAMKTLPFIRAAAYVGLPDESLGERAVAVYAAQPGQEPPDGEAQIRSVLSAGGFIVDEVRRVDDIPLDSRHHSKVEYGALRQMLLAAREARK